MWATFRIFPMAVGRPHGQAHLIVSQKRQSKSLEWLAAAFPSLGETPPEHGFH